MIKKVSLLLAIIWSVNSFAQENNMSPYSYFGIGDNYQQESVAASSMGGVAISSRFSNAANFSNPAGQSALKYTNFNVAVNSKFMDIADAKHKQQASTNSLSYLSLAFPIGKKAGLVIGLQPNSTVGYAIEEEIFDANDELIESNSFKGNGGTNRFFGSFGYQVIEGLSLGLEVDYIFGKTENNIVNMTKDVSYLTRHQSMSRLSGASFKLGGQYEKEIKEKITARIGATVQLENSINADSDEYFYNFDYSAGAAISHDTLIANTNVAGKITRPMKLGAGLGIGKKNNWFVGMDYTSQQALNFDPSIFINNNKIRYEDASSLKFGGFWVPKSNSLTSYWNRVIYKAGFHYDNTGLAIKTQPTATEYTSINDFGISFGLGLPIGNQLSEINLGFEYGKRGRTDNGLVQENYYNLRLSLNLVDKWFRKNKID